MSEKKYPIGGYAPGNYHNRCSTCERSFFGDKQAVQCEPCALEAKARFDALPIEEQMQLIKRNGQIAQVLFERPVSPERDLILRIIEQWGNAMQMDNMEQWLKDYAATKAQPRTGWVKANSFAYVAGDPYHAKDDNSKGAGSFDVAGNFTWGDGSITPHHAQGDLLILDDSPAEQPVLPTFWDVAKAFKWAAEYGNEIGEQLSLLTGQWTIIIENEENENETKDITPGNVAELYCLQKGFEKDEQPVREVNPRNFAEWLRLNWKASQNGWVDALGKWETTHGLYNLFKEQKEK